MEWINSARPAQIPPSGDWFIWLVLAGRGFGKTRLAVEDALQYCYWNDSVRYGVIAATTGDLRKTMFEGESGLMARVAPEMVKGGDYNKSKFELQLENGSLIQGFSADEPNRLRGPQFHRAWADEVASWRYVQEAWDNLVYCTRLGEDTRITATTTPKPTKFIREFVKRSDIKITTGSTFDNEDNLSARFIQQMRDRYEGTRQGEQELFGKLLEDVEGALWKREIILYAKRPENLEEFLSECIRIVVAIDPAVTANENSDETGIIVVAKHKDGNFYVLDDLSGVWPVDKWPQIAVNAYHRYKADCIVGEVNNGGDLVERSIKFEDKLVRFKQVRASRGKIVRAEPIAQLYEKKLVYHLGILEKLETQMCNFAPAQLLDSPDRVDALVWGVTELADTFMVEPRIRRII